MVRKEYSAGAVKLSFWFLEFKKTVELLATGTEMAEIPQTSFRGESLRCAISGPCKTDLSDSVSQDSISG